MNFAPGNDDDSDSDFDCAPPPPDEDGKVEPKLDNKVDEDEEDDDEDDEDDEEDDDDDEEEDGASNVKKPASSAPHGTQKATAEKDNAGDANEDYVKNESKSASAVEVPPSRGGPDAKKVVLYFNRAFFAVDVSCIRRGYSGSILSVTSKERLVDMVASNSDVDKWPSSEDINAGHIWVLAGEKDGKLCVNWYIRIQVHGSEKDSDDRNILRPIPRSVCKMLYTEWGNATKFPLMKGSRLLTHKSYIPTDFNMKIFSPATLGWTKVEQPKINTFGFVPKKEKKDGDSGTKKDAKSGKASSSDSSKEPKQVGGKRKIEMARQEEGDDGDGDDDSDAAEDEPRSQNEKTTSKNEMVETKTRLPSAASDSDENDDKDEKEEEEDEEAAAPAAPAPPAAPAKSSVKKIPPTDPMAESAENPKKKKKNNPSLKSLSQNATVKSSTSSLMPAIGKAAAATSTAAAASAPTPTVDSATTVATTGNGKKPEKTGSDPMQVEEGDDPVQTMLKSANLIPVNTNSEWLNGKTASRVDTVICNNKPESENKITHAIPAWAKSFKMTIEFSSEAKK